MTARIPVVLTMCVLLLTNIPVFAQDVIFFRSGNELKAKIMEITDYEVKYRNFEDQSGPIHTITKATVFMIRYENGTKEVFENQAPPPAPPAFIPNPDPKFDPDTSDFAKKRRKKFDGPRVGVTYVSPGTSADYLAAKGKRPLVTQFGWQFEARLFTVEETSGIFEFVPMIGGVEQGMFIPSASMLLGIRTGSRFIFEFAIGPNFSIVPDYYGNGRGFAGLVIAAGTSFKKGNVYFPVNIAFVPSVGNVIDVYNKETQTTEKIKYYTGSRLSLIVGFNSRKR
jgi:hypothetical protein